MALCSNFVALGFSLVTNYVCQIEICLGRNAMEAKSWAQINLVPLTRVEYIFSQGWYFLSVGKSSISGFSCVVEVVSYLPN